jgi:ELWxxDGT repeat protein
VASVLRRDIVDDMQVSSRRDKRSMAMVMAAMWISGMLLGACSSAPASEASVAQPSAMPQKLVDLSTVRPNLASTPRGFAAVNGVALFFSATRMGLFRSDGTPGGTQLVRDLEPTHDADFPTPHIVALGTRGFWTQDDALFASDGTPEGTTLVAFPGPRGFTIGELTAYQGELYLATLDGLVRSDGTAAGTRVIASVQPAVLANAWQVVGDKLYFACATPAEGDELCVSDGTGAGTFVVKDVVPGARGSNVSLVGGVGGRLLFAASAGGFGRSLWSTDGTLAGTAEILAATSGDVVSDSAGPPAILDGRAWFACNTRQAGAELCRSDGTPAGTAALDVVPGAGSLSPSNPVVSGGRLFFTASQADVGTELWVSDGTAAGTSLLKDVLPGAGSGVSSSLLVPIGDTVYFTAHSAAAKAISLWLTDGTPAGTVQLKEILEAGREELPPLDLAESVVLGTRLLFAADDGVHALEPWVSDGTTDGTQLLKDARPPRSTVVPVELRDHHGATYLTEIESPARLLWRSDGTIAGTTIFQRASLSDLTSAGYWLYYQGGGLWKTDGEPATRIPLPGRAAQLRPLGSDLAFLSTTPDRNRGLFLSDGTAAGTRLTNPIIVNADGLAVANGRLWLSGFDGSHGNELWTGDGSTTGVHVVTDIRPGAADSRPDNFVEVNGTTVFAANDGVSGRELWKTDGSAGGTVRIADLVPGLTGSNPDHLWSWNGCVLFFAGDFFGKSALWSTDGTTAGTTALARLSVEGDPGFVAWDGLVFFRAADDELGAELWRTDGTAAGTVRVSDLAPGPLSSNPQQLRLVAPAGPLAFVAEEPATGREVWQLTQPLGAPQLVADLAPGPASSRPTAIGIQGSKLIVTADTGDGYAIWRIDGVGPDATPPALICPADIAVSTSDPTAVVSFAATATDNSGAAPSITADRASGSVFRAGDTRVAVAATDGSNNTSRCTFVVHVGAQVPGDGGVDGGPGGPGPIGPGANPDPGARGPIDEGGCNTAGPRGCSSALLVALVAAAMRRRRRTHS